MDVKLIAICLFLTLLNTVTATEGDGKCRALALRGGGDKGAY